MDETPVLIAGAGPTGLMLANQLARLGVAFRLVDGKAGPTHESRALGVQARTLELYAALGIADEAVEQGRPMTAANLYVGQRHVRRIPLGDAGQGATAFPYVLIYEQSQNEALLLRRLQQGGADVHWQCRLEAFEPQADGVTATLRHADGRKETLRCAWLVGCDGARSAVRERLGLAFSGGTYEHAFYVADVAVDWALPHGELTACLSKQTFALFFPMPGGEKRYRLIGVMPPDASLETPNLSFADIEAAVRAQMDIDVRFSDVRWFSAYRVHHRCVERLREGRVLLAGDAAHVHSPVGAQGMNTGLQDASNLAWKLALAGRGWAGEALVASYHDERWPIAQRLLRTTDQAFQFIVSPDAFVRALRLQVLPRVAALAMGRPAVQRRVFRLVSQIGIHYRDSALSTGTRALAVQAGDRLPHAEIGRPPRASAACFTAPGFHVLLMQRKPHGSTALETEAADWQERLLLAWPAVFHVHALSPASDALPLLDAVGVRERAVLVLRPDQHIAYLDEDFDLHAVLGHLRDGLGLRAAGAH